VNLQRSLLIGLLALGLVVILALALRSERVLVNGLPPRVIVNSRVEAQEMAGALAIGVLGTGSMAPYIPSALNGADPLKTIVAYAVVNTNLDYKDITPGALVIYSINYVKGSNTMHQAALLDASGWIMTGLNNKEYENRVRVTSDNFVGIVSKVYIWKP
jgi:hypothetical protein